MSDRLAGKVALITGGTAGIGEATVRRLSAEGAKVIFTGSRKEAADPICADTGATFVAHKVQDAAAWDELSARIRKDFGRLDIAFANAGTEKGDSSIEAITLENWNNILGVNLTGVMLTVQNAVRIMKDNPEGPVGSVIINSSMNALRAMGNYMAYSVTKSAVVALGKSAANYCGQAGYKIRVNSILPGVVETEMITSIVDSQPDPAAARAMYEGMSPLKRMAQVGEVAGLVAFLSSDEAAFISGGEYTIDGATTAGMSGV
ncbi:SDR family NAD(P)-dependent oxidoreductase [Croceicoccus mobilis]|uniref:Oxidoreductase n=1 Tax=Croceicoccus mobilis TaxID=1703339 RepID=A0A916Z814_9SPHN|nr:SDR family oxidoreductase [Croceicoccus mobilis]GGD78858.1 oxidoreductase [Croceicoccus mobilis]